ncbi:WD repeat-containing protein 18 [Copidosoma floridanum]|uniref:WD repeat-containing protein 18 n=1 Tax=Copidosoma floridanum TaxID=29053 RepID=UPI0006C9BDF4|nr:WD repeat-containing protein 18 [Copidosoma floridanum]
MRCPHELVMTCDSGCENWSAAAWDPRTGSLLSTYKHASALGHHSLQLLKDSYVIASSATKPNLFLWPLNSQTLVPNLRLSTPGKVTALACTSNGSYIAAAIGEKIYIWQTCNGQLINSFARHYQTISCLTFSKDGSCLASGAEDSFIFVWSLSQVANSKQAEPLNSFNHHSLPVKDLKFGHIVDFGRLYSVSLDKSARIYDVHSSLLLLTLVFDVPLVALCTDIMENELYVGSSTGVVMKCSLRDPPRGIQHHVAANDDKIVVFKEHTSSITSLAVSVDCSTLLTGSTDGMVHLWDIPSCQIILTLKHKAPVVSAFFVPAYDNFSVNNLQPSLEVKPLQRVSNVGNIEFMLDVHKNNEDDAWILDFEGQADDLNTKNPQDCNETQRELEDARAEIERLKRINGELYKYSVRNILDKQSSIET